MHKNRSFQCVPQVVSVWIVWSCANVTTVEAVRHRMVPANACQVGAVRNAMSRAKKAGLVNVVLENVLATRVWAAILWTVNAFVLPVSEAKAVNYVSSKWMCACHMLLFYSGWMVHFINSILMKSFYMCSLLLPEELYDDIMSVHLFDIIFCTCICLYVCRSVSFNSQKDSLQLILKLNARVFVWWLSGDSPAVIVHFTLAVLPPYCFWFIFLFPANFSMSLSLVVQLYYIINCLPHFFSFCLMQTSFAPFVTIKHLQYNTALRLTSLLRNAERELEYASRVSSSGRGRQFFYTASCYLSNSHSSLFLSFLLTSWKGRFFFSMWSRSLWCGV